MIAMRERVRLCLSWALAGILLVVAGLLDVIWGSVSLGLCVAVGGVVVLAILVMMVGVAESRASLAVGLAAVVALLIPGRDMPSSRGPRLAPVDRSTKGLIERGLNDFGPYLKRHADFADYLHRLGRSGNHLDETPSEPS